MTPPGHLVYAWRGIRAFKGRAYWIFPPSGNPYDPPSGSTYNAASAAAWQRSSEISHRDIHDFESFRLLPLITRCILKSRENRIRRFSIFRHFNSKPFISITYNSADNRFGKYRRRISSVLLIRVLFQYALQSEPFVVFVPFGMYAYIDAINTFFFFYFNETTHIWI